MDVQKSVYIPGSVLDLKSPLAVGGAGSLCSWGNSFPERGFLLSGGALGCRCRGPVDLASHSGVLGFLQVGHQSVCGHQRCPNQEEHQSVEPVLPLTEGPLPPVQPVDCVQVAQRQVVPYLVLVQDWQPHWEA